MKIQIELVDNDVVSLLIDDKDLAFKVGNSKRGNEIGTTWELRNTFASLVAQSLLDPISNILSASEIEDMPHDPWTPLSPEMKLEAEHELSGEAGYKHPVLYKIKYMPLGDLKIRHMMRYLVDMLYVRGFRDFDVAADLDDAMELHVMDGKINYTFYCGADNKWNYIVDDSRDHIGGDFEGLSWLEIADDYACILTPGKIVFPPKITKGYASKGDDCGGD